MNGKPRAGAGLAPARSRPHRQRAGLRMSRFIWLLGPALAMMSGLAALGEHLLPGERALFAAGNLVAIVLTLGTSAIVLRHPRPTRR